MLNKEDSFKHGEHNESACEAIHPNGNFPDWTITTAFYAAMHFANSRIFPFFHQVGTRGSVEIKSVDEYCSYMQMKGRHQQMRKIVGEKASDIADRYDWLLDTSCNARYHNHRQDGLIVQCAMNYMRQIKKACTPVPASKKK